MRAEELMIGDYVKYIGSGYGDVKNGDIIKVESVQGRYIGVGNNAMADDDLFEPIPLTAEILIENDFHNGSILEKLNDENTFIKHNCFSFIEGGGLKIAGSEWATKIVEIDFSNGKINLEIITQSICNVVFDDIHYVHELQHSMRLCGIAKEIAL